ncbi:FAD-binding oxidoreductase [Tsukamurella soli]|uniref:FAD-binding PCMH-type domain-containing protein n=1 Tax=Tsukamurella soli TaxID=644556 RepID=A0ABP8J413_9ACTN
MGAHTRGHPRHGALLLRLHAFTGVDVDPITGSARVEGGTPWRNVLAATAPHGLTALHGSAPDVSVAGYLLGGGLSFYSRSYGLAASSVLAIEVVTAAGDLLRTSPTAHPDLFWALLGGVAASEWSPPWRSHYYRSPTWWRG